MQKIPMSRFTKDLEKQPKLNLSKDQNLQHDKDQATIQRILREFRPKKNSETTESQPEVIELFSSDEETETVSNLKHEREQFIADGGDKSDIGLRTSLHKKMKTKDKMSIDLDANEESDMNCELFTDDELDMSDELSINYEIDINDDYANYELNTTDDSDTNSDLNKYDKPDVSDKLNINTSGEDSIKPDSVQLLMSSFEKTYEDETELDELVEETCAMHEIHPNQHPTNKVDSSEVESLHHNDTDRLSFGLQSISNNEHTNHKSKAEFGAQMQKEKENQARTLNPSLDTNQNAYIDEPESIEVTEKSRRETVRYFFDQMRKYEHPTVVIYY
ncbi:hypothetical protein BY458DRAFT_512497 [Sporodiniella umbellata]|nr:hypothetical protein BY458DRAFT_512497 [Sporodiniella umbellata]